MALAISEHMQILHRWMVLVLAACGDEPTREEVSPIPQLAHVKPGRATSADFDVPRAVVDRALEQQAELMRCTRIIPEQANGRVIGIRVFPRPGSLIARLGIESGDLLTAINGFDITSPDKALEAYARLRSADMLSVALRRRGVPMEITYRIR